MKAQTISVLGLDNTGTGIKSLGEHLFEFRESGDVTHYVNGEKRAEIEAQHWPDYCAGCPEAADAEKRRQPEQVSGDSES